MKIVFFGTPDFAIPVLTKIYESEHEILAVVTAPDKQRGRGRKVQFTPVKSKALELGLKVLQPDKLKNPEFVESLKKLGADLFVVVAFKILPPEVFTIPPRGSFNLHASLLPKYRGAAPIQWALINGEKITGVTTFFLEEKVDTGNIILQEKLEILDEDNFGSLHDKLSLLGADVTLKTINLIEAGNVKLTKQDDSLATPAPKITKETCRIDWSKGAEAVHNLVRGLSPYPGAFFTDGIKIFKIFKTEISDVNLEPGETLSSKKELLIGCGENSISVLEIQPEGRKRMTIEEFLRGYSLSKVVK